ncbi:MAG TPA: class I SAM-dependent methyltransferase [Vicinamibacterales bacterium]|nr:class I SAM-dependent methyltransferase [Vicinamibacterales bacterium]
MTLGAPIDQLLDRLYAQHASQMEAMGSYFAARAAEGPVDWSRFDDRTNAFLRDKLVALDRDKAEFCYHVCRALQARRVVEAGTSFGVSTIFLAAAVRDNGGGTVIATEYEPTKAAIARRHFAEAGLSSVIDLREGDLRTTLAHLGAGEDHNAPVDFMLIDIWTPMALPALSLVAPRLRQGAVVICDNTTQFREAYHDYFAFVHDPPNGLRTMTLPFEGGLEFTVKAR